VINQLQERIKAMPVGRSLHVGINQVSSAVFPNASTLTGPENDAQAMSDLAHDRFQFVTKVVKGPEATYARVKAELLQAANDSQPKDIFLFTFAGHGTAQFDPSPEEGDNQDEAILLYDALLFDDELSMDIWPAFKKDVRVLMIADSCHSGTVVSLAGERGAGGRCPHVRQISNETREEHLRAYREFYKRLSVPVFAPIQASVLLLAACGDFEETPDGDPLGAFTAAMLQVINNQQPANYRDLIGKISLLVGPQTPRLTPIEPADQAFINQVPFTI
jgi:hypothetical protein